MCCDRQQPKQSLLTSPTPQLSASFMTEPRSAWRFSRCFPLFRQYVGTSCCCMYYPGLMDIQTECSLTRALLFHLDCSRISKLQSQKPRGQPTASITPKIDTSLTSSVFTFDGLGSVRIRSARSSSSSTPTCVRTNHCAPTCCGLACPENIMTSRGYRMPSERS